MNMKTNNFLLLISCLLFAVNLQATKLWRVTKDASFMPHFGDLQLAINGADSGDTIYVYPGNYGTVEISKKLTIFGVGYFLAENAKDTITTFVGTSNVDNINFIAGADFSIISGMTVNNGINCTNVNNITISGNRYGNIGLTSSNYIVIKKNYGGGISGIYCSNTLVSNNILSGINFDVNSNLFFQNNYTNGRIIMSNSTLINNIDSYDSFQAYHFPNQFNNCSIMNNISLNALYGSNNGNIQSALDLIFTYPIIADNYQLSSNSAAKGIGLGGVDCGPFGGNDPYCLSGLNYIPSIAKLSMPLNVTGNNGLSVKVIVKSNR